MPVTIAVIPPEITSAIIYSRDDNGHLGYLN